MGRFLLSPASPVCGAMTVKVALEIKEFCLQISRRPEQHTVGAFAANRADQAFDEWMRNRQLHCTSGAAMPDTACDQPSRSKQVANVPTLGARGARQTARRARRASFDRTQDTDRVRPSVTQSEVRTIGQINFFGRHRLGF